MRKKTFLYCKSMRWSNFRRRRKLLHLMLLQYFLTPQRLLQILDNITHILNAHRKPDAPFRNPDALTLSPCKITMRRNRWITYLREDIAQRRCRKTELQPIHKAKSRLPRLLL